METRGPNAEGYWEDKKNSVVMGHRRLSILDLDIRSNQPMVSENSRYVVAFNGEIYNFRALKKELEEEGERFQTQGDTEVLLKLYAREGKSMLSRLRGMFAFAIWDVAEQSLFVARDPYGIKPLYIATTPGAYLVASQVKALMACEMVSTETDPRGIAGFWLTGSVPEPRTWFKAVQSVPAGSWFSIDSSGIHGPNRFHDIGDHWRHAPVCSESIDRVQERVREAVLDSVRHHMVADVPVGVFLSGGIDSGSLSGLMSEISPDCLSSTTIRFPEFDGGIQDEVTDAQTLAGRYGINHYIKTVTRDEFESDLPEILASMDQPSIDGVNTWYAAKATAEQGLRVVVSGIGGDELFFGYPGFRRIPSLLNIWARLASVPGARMVASAGLKFYGRMKKNSRWALVPEYATSVEGGYLLNRGLFSINDLPLLMGEETTREVCSGLSPIELVMDLTGGLPDDTKAAIGQLESQYYMRNQLLRDSDWASMSHSVELRTPLVDSWLLAELGPVIRCFDKFNGKDLLAHCPKYSLPQSLVDKRKTGFGIPLGAWLGETDMLESMELPAMVKGPNVHVSKLWAAVVAKMAY